jgi:uncharacterized membrane protein YqhA
VKALISPISFVQNRYGFELTNLTLKPLRGSLLLLRHVFTQSLHAGIMQVFKRPLSCWFNAMPSNKTPKSKQPIDRFSQTIGHSRFIVLLAVIAVLLVAVSLFLLGTIQAVVSVWHAWSDVFHGDLHTSRLTVEFLEIVSVMLKAVVFYIIGVGLYSLFVAPLNITISLGVQTLYDLESKIVSVVVVILGVTFLQHFIQWKDPLETLLFGGAVALVVAPLVLFQRYAHKAKEEQKAHSPDEQTRAQRSMFEEDHEKAEITPEMEQGTRKPTDRRPNDS